MAFELLSTNLLGQAIIDQPGGVLATSENFIDPYTYAQQYMPELIGELHMRNGKGSIIGFCRITGSMDTYASDQIQHMEEGRLHNILKGVTVAGNNFTSPTPHNLRVKDRIKISDGIRERQATVSAITSPTVFVALNDAAGAYGFTDTVDVINISSTFGKGEGQFEKGKNWNGTTITNFTHIMKETYSISKSNMVHKSWVMTPEGPKWFNHEMERTGTMFENEEELTQIFHVRAATGSDSVNAGFAPGLKGVVQQIEERGNIGNQYITTVGDLSNIARRAKQQGTCRSFTVWADHTQMAFFRTLMSSVNSSFAGGANYGIFNNSRDMALALDFSSVIIDGVSFHFTPWTVLEDPTLMGSAKFMTTNIACLIVPAGENYVTENGNTVTRPYLTLRHRSDGSVNRNKQIDIYGLGTPHPERKDIMTADYLSEITNQLVGANNYTVVRRGTFYS
jgi:hypothetical protein